MGAEVEEFRGWFASKGSAAETSLGALIDPPRRSSHRYAMAFSVAALIAEERLARSKTQNASAFRYRWSSILLDSVDGETMKLLQGFHAALPALM
jgi:hypothetical protein